MPPLLLMDFWTSQLHSYSSLWACILQTHWPMKLQIMPHSQQDDGHHTHTMEVVCWGGHPNRFESSSSMQPKFWEQFWHLFPRANKQRPPTVRVTIVHSRLWETANYAILTDCLTVAGTVNWGECNVHRATCSWMFGEQMSQNHSGYFRSLQKVTIVNLQSSLAVQQHLTNQGCTVWLYGCMC